MSSDIHHSVSLIRTLVNWGITLVPANLFLSLLVTFYVGPDAMGKQLPFEAIDLVFQFAVLMLWSLLFLSPVLGLLLLLSASLNKRSLPFEHYFVFHNLFHLLIALVWFTIFSYLTDGLFDRHEVPFLGLVYTVSGLVVWNASFLVSFARKKRSW